MDQVEVLTLKNRQGEVRFEKSGGAWAMVGLSAGEVLDASKVETLLGRVSPLTMLRPLGKTERPDYGLAQPAAVLEVKTADKTYLLTVGAQNPEDSSHVVRSSESPCFVAACQYSVGDLVDRGRDWFLVQPTPIPTP